MDTQQISVGRNAFVINSQGNTESRYNETDLNRVTLKTDSRELVRMRSAPSSLLMGCRLVQACGKMLQQFCRPSILHWLYGPVLALMWIYLREEKTCWRQDVCKNGRSYFTVVIPKWTGLCSLLGGRKDRKVEGKWGSWATNQNLGCAT